MIKETKDGIEFQLRISPNASKNEVIKTCESVKIKMTAPPVDGKANKCLIEYLSKLFRVPKTSIVILRGETSKDKTLLIKISDGDKIKLVKNILE